METYEHTYSEAEMQEQNPTEMPPVQQLPSFEMQQIPKPPRHSRKSGNFGIGKWILAAVMIVAIVAGSCCVTAMLINRHWERKTNLLYATTNKSISQLRQQLEEQMDKHALSKPIVITPEGSDSEEGLLSPRQVYALNVNAVVAISNQGATTNIYGQTTQTASSGTGFIISEDGYIVSNYHVVEGAKTLEVITADSKTYDAELIGYDEINDISVLKIEAADLPCVTFGSSDVLLVGDQVAAIGNPLGELTSTLTVGYVSAKDRMVNTDGSYINMLQTDAAINSGNSGGPLFNMKGQVVGITTAKYSGTSNSGASIEGIGFAIPLDDVIDMIEDLRDLGYIESGYLGVMVQDVSQSDVSNGKPKGAFVAEVTPGTCAEKAGILEGDIIVDLGSYPVDSLSALSRALRKFKPGETTVITVNRDGEEKTLEVTFDKKPASETKSEGWQSSLSPSGRD